MPKLSVIIPTFNRRDVLLEVLDRLAHQEGISSNDYEIVVVDDGSTDGTPDVLANYSAGSVRLATATQPENRGPACARNRALALSSGSVVLITGDDIVPPPTFLARHLAWHHAHPSVEDALLGRVTWPANPPPTDFMTWLAGAGRAFFFSYPEHAGPAPADRFYTCNVSLKRDLLERCGHFDETFRFASHEDLEIGLRLARRGGMRLHYEPELVAAHDHRLTYRSSLRRVYLMGYSSIAFWQKVPPTSSVAVRSARRILRRIAAITPLRMFCKSLISRAEGRDDAPRLWSMTLSACYWMGAADGARGKPPSLFDTGGD